MKTLLMTLVLMTSGVSFAAEVEIPVSVQDLAELKVEAPKSGEAIGIKEGDSLAAANTSEENIPVNLESKGGAKAADSSLKELFLAFSLLGGFGLLAYLGLTKYRTRNAKVSQFQMKILAQHHLGPKKSLAVVRVAGESILIGVTDHHISMIKSLSLLDDEIPEETPASFGGMFSKGDETPKEAATEAPAQSNSAPAARLSFRKKNSEQAAEGSENQEDFTISKIRDVVHRQVRNLKNLE